MKSQFILICCISLCMLASCKKTKVESPVVNYTSIVHNQANLVLNHFVNPTKLNLDIDENGTIDFTIYMHYGYSSATSFQYFCNIGSVDSHLISVQPVAAPVNERIRLYSGGAKQDTLNSIWKSYTFMYHSANVAGTVIDETAIVTGEDVFTAFKLNKNGAYHYGWMRMACMTDYKTLTIKDWAYDTIPNKPIQIGQLN